MTRNWGGSRRARRARRLTIVAVAVALATVSAIALGPASLSSAFPQPGTNVRISPFTPALGDREAFGPSMSHDGRFVAYLGPWPTNPDLPAVYLKDRSSALPPQLVVEPTPLSCGSGEFVTTVAIRFLKVAMSDDAKTFAIGVQATGAADDGCGMSDNYVEVVTIGSAPIVGPLFTACPLKVQTPPLPPGTFTSSAELDGMSADGTQVLVDTNPTVNAVPACHRNLLTWNTATNTTFDIINGQAAPLTQLEPWPLAGISADGKHVAFIGSMLNNPTYTPQLYTYDRDVDGNGVLDEPNVAPNDHRIFQAIPIDLGGTFSTDVALSRDGRVVAFNDRASGGDQIEIMDRDPATSQHKFPLEPNAQRAFAQLTNGDSSSFTPALSSDGRYVAFISTATNLLPGVALDPTDTCSDGEEPMCKVFVADRVGVGGKPQFELASDAEVDGDGLKTPNPDDNSGSPSVSDNGRVIAYDSLADNLLPAVECDTPPCDAANRDRDSDVFVHITQPSLVGTPNPLDLGPATPGATSPPKVATFTPTGFGAVRTTTVDIVGPNANEFAISPTQTCTGVVLHAADQCLVSIVFKPLHPGSATATLEVHHDGTGGVAKVALRGGGVTVLSAFSLTPTALDFGKQILTVQPAAQTVTAKNSTTAPIVFDPSTINGAAAGDYHVSADTCQTQNPAHELAPGKTCTISVVFKPRSIGDRNAALVVTAHLLGTPPFVAMVSLHGTTPMPAVQLSPGVAHPRSVVQALGQNWPPGSTVTITVDGLPGVQTKSFVVPATAIVPDAQQFDPSASVLVYPRAEVGTRVVSGSAPSADVDMTPAAPPATAISFPFNFLVQHPTVNGELGFVVRNG